MTKKIKSFTYTGFGFPIELHNVEMIKINDEFHPKIDIRKLANSTIESLVTQQKRLTGNQIKFIRSYFSMSLRRFAHVVNESHMAVKKWEDFQNNPTNMDINIEILLRLYIYDHLIKKNDRKKIEFYHRYVELTTLFSNQATR